MITQAKLTIYEKFSGNIDALARVPTRIKQPISDADWRLIDTTLRDLFLVQSGLASAAFETSVRTKAAELAENESVYQRLLEIAKLRSRGSEKWLTDHSLFR
jgi:hypothetical protein